MKIQTFFFLFLQYFNLCISLNQSEFVLLGRSDGSYNFGLRNEKGLFIGHVAFTLEAPVASLDIIRVARDFRRQGNGKDLFKFVLEQARQEGCNRLEWRVVPWDHVGHYSLKQFYLSCGAQVCKNEPGKCVEMFCSTSE